MSPETFAPFLEQIDPAFRAGDPEVDRKGPEGANVRALYETYAALARGDVAAALAHFTEDVELTITGPPVVPFLGRWRGRDDVGAAVAANFAMIEESHPDILSVTAQGDTVVVVAHETGRLRPSGRPYALHWVQVFRFRDVRVCWVMEVVDGYSLF
jgi:ketosteroid isomerase-like protein